MTYQTGLTTDEVAERVARGQVNASQSRTSRSFTNILRTNIFTRFNALILTLAVVVIIVDQSVINALFGLVMIINSAIGIIQETQAKRKLDRLAILSAPRVHAIRDGAVTDLPTEQIVLDDTLQIGLGDQIAADGTVIESAGLEVDESLLTGESDPIYKKQGETVLSGSFVVAGAGVMHVTAVGADAYASKLTADAKRFQTTHSELLAATNQLLKWISWLLIIVAPLLLWGQLRIDGGSWRDAVVHATAAIVGMIPEGLVLLTSMAFLLAAVSLARRNVLVQQLPAVEGLARVDTLLLDKTGTLTEGKIRFEAIIDVNDKEKFDVERALATLASRATSPTNDAIREVLNNQTPAEITREVPFSSARKWAAISIAVEATEKREASENWLLGAPEILFTGMEHPMKNEAQEIAGTGKRVLVLMKSLTEPTAQKLPKQRVPKALVILSEKIRTDAQETLAFFKKQNVTAKVISGDSPMTVGAVAHTVGIKGEAFDARELPKARAALNKLLAHTHIFGRVQPEQKREIAQALQSEGHVVAMTGDGVNDALALKDADIGIAMNSGAGATKAVAEIVLLDNKFAHMPKVLAEGRRVIANIERVANLFIIKNVYSLTLSLAVTILGLQYPFVPVQMTVISALTIGLPAFLLALAPNDKRYVPGFLKRVLGFAVPVGVVTAFMMLAVFSISRGLGASIAESSTAVSVVVFMTSAWVLFTLAKPVQGWKIGLILFVLMAFVAIVVFPPTRQAFEYDISIALLPWALAFGTLGAVLVHIIWKLDQKRYNKAQDV